MKIDGLGECKGKIIASHLLFRNLLEEISQYLSCVANIILYGKHKALEKSEQVKRKLVLEEALNIRAFPSISDLILAVLLTLERELAFSPLSFPWES